MGQNTTQHPCVIGTRIMWLLGTAEEPMTAEEMADELGEKLDSVKGQCTKLYRTGYAIRRYRGEPQFGGSRPYEYAIAPR